MEIHDMSALQTEQGSATQLMEGSEFASLLNKEFKPKRSILVCNESRPRIHGAVQILPWKRFLEELWSGKVI